MRRLIYKQTTRQVRIDFDFHKKLRIEAAEKGSTIKNLLEEKAGWEPPTPTSKTNQTEGNNEM